MVKKCLQCICLGCGARFALVPRGDNLFSIRLVEALAFGAVPVILSDDYIMRPYIMRPYIKHHYI